MEFSAHGGENAFRRLLLKALAEVLVATCPSSDFSKVQDETLEGTFSSKMRGPDRELYALLKDRVANRIQLLIKSFLSGSPDKQDSAFKSALETLVNEHNQDFTHSFSLDRLIDDKYLSTTTMGEIQASDEFRAIDAALKATICYVEDSLESDYLHDHSPMAMSEVTVERGQDDESVFAKPWEKMRFFLAMVDTERQLLMALLSSYAMEEPEKQPAAILNLMMDMEKAFEDAPYWEFREQIRRMLALAAECNDNKDRKTRIIT